MMFGIIVFIGYFLIKLKVLLKESGLLSKLVKVKDMKLFLSSLALLSIASLSAQETVQVERRIIAAEDDAGESDKYGYVTPQASNVSLIKYDWDQWDKVTSGLRFQSMLIPSSATITRAYLEFTAEAARSEVTDLIVKAELNADANFYEKVDYNISDRSLTNAQVSWSPEAWLAPLDVTEAQRSTDLSTIIQEVIVRLASGPDPKNQT